MEDELPQKWAWSGSRDLLCIFVNFILPEISPEDTRIIFYAGRPRVRQMLDNALLPSKGALRGYATYF